MNDMSPETARTAAPQMPAQVINATGRVREWHDVTREIFEADIVEAGQPAILRGLAADWPILQAARQSSAALGAYLKTFDGGQRLSTLAAHPGAKARYFYNTDMSGFNFETRQIPLSKIVDKLLELADDPAPMGVYAGSADTRDALPGFQGGNAMPLLDDDIVPRVWLSNTSRVAAHYDIMRNIAVSVAGRRRFTLFPPDQVGNLYHGPLEFTMAGPPASMVDFHAPDYARYPRFREAEKAGLLAELEPGDAIFIPTLWWHHVESFGPFNALVNYWWNTPGTEPIFESLMLAMLRIRDQPRAEREAWRAFFDHFVFGDNAANVADHLPARWQTVAGKASPQRNKMVFEYIMSKLREQKG